MNKNRVDQYLPRAIEALDSEHCKISNVKGELSKTFRGQISSFGAAITMGSFKAAVAFLASDSQNESSKISRSKLLQAIDYVIDSKLDKPRDAKTICIDIFNERDAGKINAIEEKYIDASIALKLAMNAYTLVKD